MTLLRNFVKISDNLLCLRKWNGWNAELYFGSKVEVPSPPKRPLTAYMIFCKENRENILKDNPSLSSPEQIKILAEKWGQLTRDMKKPFEISARESTLLYGELHKKFYENLTEEQKEELLRLKAEKKESRRVLKLKKALRDSGMPKPPVPAYALFVQSEAKNKASMKNSLEFIKKAAEAWKSISKDTKKIFEDQSQAEKKRYANELGEWRSRMLSEGKTDLIKAFLDMKGGRGKMLLDQYEKRSASVTRVNTDASKS